MDKAFWLERWQQGQIGFHQVVVNDYLQRYWNKLGVKAPAKIFVPLCGKSLDMLWLRGQGYHVMGVELSEQACRAFFAENDLVFECVQTEGFLLFKGEGIDLYCGDFFHITAQDMTDVVAVYDRAAMIAMPKLVRADYVRHLRMILPRHASLFLVTMEYLQTQMEGPPFAVSSQDVTSSYADGYKIEPLLRLDILADNPRFSDRGVTELVEAVYLIHPR